MRWASLAVLWRRHCYVVAWVDVTIVQWYCWSLRPPTWCWNPSSSIFKSHKKIWRCQQKTKHEVKLRQKQPFIMVHFNITFISCLDSDKKDIFLLYNNQPSRQSSRIILHSVWKWLKMSHFWHFHQFWIGFSLKTFDVGYSTIIWYPCMCLQVVLTLPLLLSLTSC